jgi:hypothetical protein
VKLEFFQLFLDTPDKGFFNVFSEYAYKSKAPPASNKLLRGRGFSYVQKSILVVLQARKLSECDFYR